MLFGNILTALLSVSALVVSASELPVSENEPEVVATAAFPETNPFNHVVNGEKNQLTITVENKSDRNVTILKIAGALLHPDTNALIKNLTILHYNAPLVGGVQMNLPYTFYSEFKPGDHRLNIWMEHAIDDESHHLDVYDSIVTVVEPAISFFDFKLLSTYLVVAGLFGGLSYFAYLTFVPQPKKSRSKKQTNPSVSAPVGTVTATGAGGYQEEWIPEHHLRKSKSGKKQGGAASGTSGDELSGPESDGKRKKGRK